MLEKVRYDEENRRGYFNMVQYFEGISKAVWEYQNYTMIYVRITKGHIV
nr:hypothetical protein BSM_25140 [uncultured archaeon]